MLKFRICKWLDDDAFKELLRFAKYEGREDYCSVFSIYVNKLEPEELEEILEYVQNLGGQLDGASVARARALLRDRREVVVETSDGGFLIKSKRRLSDFLADFRERGALYYSKKHGAFVVRPYAIIDVISRLASEGFEIVDRTGLISARLNPSVKFELTVGLRSYQEEALRKWIENNYRGVIALPTGSGKTVIGLAAIRELGVPALIVVYTQDQVREWYDKIRKLTTIPLRQVGMFYAGDKRIAEITISTYQSVYRNIHVFKDRFSLLIVDEAHHLPADKFRVIAHRIMAPYRLGLSATPYREDGRHEELFTLIGGVIYEKRLEELAAEGYIAPYTIHLVRVDLAKEEKERYLSLKKKYERLSRGFKVEDLVKRAQMGDPLAVEALRTLSEMRQLIALSRSKMEKIREIFEQEMKRGSRILVFTQYVGQAEALGKLLGAPVLTGRDDDAKRRMIFDLFKRGRYGGLILTTIGDEGIDLPDAEVGIIASSTSSRRQLIQRLGRLLRPREGKSARLYIVVARGTPEDRAISKILRTLDV